MPSSANLFPRRMNLLNQQIDELRVLLRALIGDNAFYTRKFEEAGCSYRLRDLIEYAETVPFTTRQELTDDQHAHPPFGTNVTFPMAQYARCHESAGATSRLRWLDTVRSLEALVANGAEVFRAAGVAPGDRVYFLETANHPGSPVLTIESGEYSGGLCLSGAGLDSLAQLQAVLELEVTVLCGPPAGLRRFVDAAEKEEANIGRAPVRLIISGGDTVVAPELRERVKRLWPEARFCDYLGLAETGVAAYECPVRPGVLHLLEPAFVGEVVDPATGRLVEDGTPGELVLSTLFRTGMPVLRYRTGHQVKASPESTCECGRHYLAFEGGILGPTAGPAGR